jgi:hypothetical protein
MSRGKLIRDKSQRKVFNDDRNWQRKLILPVFKLEYVEDSDIKINFCSYLPITPYSSINEKC